MGLHKRADVLQRTLISEPVGIDVLDPAHLAFPFNARRPIIDLCNERCGRFR